MNPEVETSQEDIYLGGQASESEINADPCLKIDDIETVSAALTVEQPPMQVDDSEKESDSVDNDMRLVVHSGWKPVIATGQVCRQESIDSLTPSSPREIIVSASPRKKYSSELGNASQNSLCLFYTHELCRKRPSRFY